MTYKRLASLTTAAALALASGAAHAVFLYVFDDPNGTNGALTDRLATTAGGDINFDFQANGGGGPTIRISGYQSNINLVGKTENQSISISSHLDGAYAIQDLFPADGGIGLCPASSGGDSGECGSSDDLAGGAADGNSNNDISVDDLVIMVFSEAVNVRGANLNDGGSHGETPGALDDVDLWYLSSADTLTLLADNFGGEELDFTSKTGGIFSTTWAFSADATDDTVYLEKLVVSTSTSVPEPSTLALLGVGIAALGFGNRRRKAKTKR